MSLPHWMSSSVLMSLDIPTFLKAYDRLHVHPEFGFHILLTGHVKGLCSEARVLLNHFRPRPYLITSCCGRVFFLQLAWVMAFYFLMCSQREKLGGGGGDHESHTFPLSAANAQNKRLDLIPLDSYKLLHTPPP